jgi:plasmid stabilization system protein ParE
MECRVIWSERAIRDLREICEYIGINNESASVKIGDAICAQVELLNNFPALGPIFKTDDGFSVRALVKAPYRIFYQFDPEKKSGEILHVRHSTRRPLTKNDLFS